MRASEFENVSGDERLDEIGPLISIANWFANKYQKTLSMGATKLGAGKIQGFTNQHFRTFMKFMGMNRVDWPTLTLYVVYRYMRLVMKLPDRDIMTVLNSVMKDPTVMGKKFTSVEQIRDPGKDTLVSSLSNAGGDLKKLGQVIGEKMIAAGAMQQVQNHWDKQAGIREPEQGPTDTGRSEKAAAADPDSGTTTPMPDTDKIKAALSQIAAGVSNP